MQEGDMNSERTVTSINCERTATSIADRAAILANEQAALPIGESETLPQDHTVMRRGLLAVLGGIGAAALFKTGSAKAAANATLVTGSTASYGVLASPGASAVQPLLPTIGSTTHGVIGSNSSVTVVPFGSDVAGVRNGSGLAGVLGANGSDGFGMYGISESGPGIVGVSNTAVGIRGVSTDGAGLTGVSTNSFANVLFTDAPNKAAIFAQSNAATQKIAGLFKGKVTVQGDLTVTGAKAAGVEMPDGTLATMYCQEAPEPFFEDFGRARMENGVAQISLESDFASLVRLDSYMVFLTPEGESKGLYVDKRNEHGFQVREAQGGTSTLDFTYRLVAKRKDIPGERLARQDRPDEIEMAEALGPDVRPTRLAHIGSDDDRVRQG